MIALNDYRTFAGFDPAVSRSDTYGSNELFAFNRYSVTYADDEISSALGYVFMVRPDLYLLDERSTVNDIELNEQAKTDPLFTYLKVTDPIALLSLTNVGGGPPHQFIPFLVDRVEEYQIPDLDVGTHEMVQPFTGFTTVYGGNSNAYLSKSQFSISFRESANLRVTKMFQAWINYINGITMNLYSPREYYLQSKYYEGAQVIDYATSIYYIKTRPDGEIVYFHKTTGAFPTQVPLSQQSFNRGGTQETRVQVQFVGGYPESLNPTTLGEFNYNSLGSKFSLSGNVKLAPDYDESGIGGTGFTGDLMTGSPVIIMQDNVSPGRVRFFLSWQRLEGDGMQALQNTKSIAQQRMQAQVASDKSAAAAALYTK